ncbi:hypothetical protein [Xanthomonas hortorum]|uniref:hypothetical protein n=1 Tax=Xanthomonas hortorum TaxID=56454 RepID=UPI000CEE65DA|nr:hypothetical protein [Xanthomonas hortorum]MCE4371809.1 hypothetical protein [Xanthomonas hortorum pv. hederae]PPU80324.1 hypothetical protein XhhCFBP4925_11910 [Xanthomonas hortorum pv. hederae]PUE99729.1 hypothetical protein C7T87_12395 [Xanthomonas hortorum pv. hederae]
MDTWKWAFVRCWPLSQSCEVDWTAWAVGIALGATLVTAAGVLVSMMSAAAVYYLGLQANSLARSAHNQAAIDREAADDKATEERAREERVMLFYSLYELELLQYELGILASLLEDGGAFSQQQFVSSRPCREHVAKIADRFESPRLERLLPRLHLIPRDTGDRASRLVGACHVLKSRYARAVVSNPAPDDPKFEAQRVANLEAEYLHLQRATERARDDAYKLWQKAFSMHIARV